MPAFGEQFDNLPGQAQLPLDRLVGIGYRTKHDRTAGIFPGRQLFVQAVDNIRLVIQIAFKLQTGAMPQPGMGRSRIAIDAAMFTATIGIDRTIVGHIG